MSRGILFDIDSFAVHDGPGIRLAVYFKGCPLNCAWCHSPESQSYRPELIFMADRCTSCGACAGACPNSVHAVSDGVHTLDRSACVACGLCVQECPSGSLAIKGFSLQASEIAERALRMKPFFDHTGGGITLTGGEVTAQPEFAAEVLELCRNQGVHTAIETCGACSWKTLQPIAELSDLVLYDIKLIDSPALKRWTGGDSRVIVDNLRRLPPNKVRIRVPMIPGITDTEENLAAIRRLSDETGIAQVEYLPYNESAAAKYDWLGRRLVLN